MEVKKYFIVSIIIILIKVLFGYLLNSNALIMSSLLEIMFIMYGLLTKKDNKKYKGIISSLLSIIFIILSISLIFVSVIGKLNKPSWFLILILLFILFVRYIVICFSIITSYNKKKGILLINNVTSNMDFIILGIVLGSMLITKLSKWISICKYGDILGTIIVGLIVIYYSLRVIVNSIKYMEDKEYYKEINEEEITKQKEVKKLISIRDINYGGIRLAEVNLVLNNGINMSDLSGFVLSLQDYVLKYREIVVVKLIDQTKEVVKKVHVRSKKQDARNSGSRNSKTNSKAKNSKKTNKKR